MRAVRKFRHKRGKVAKQARWIASLQPEEAAMSCKPTWAAALKPVGLHYYAGVVDDGEKALEMHKIAIQSCFGTWTSAKKSSDSHPTAEKENLEPSKTCKIATNNL